MDVRPLEVGVEQHRARCTGTWSARRSPPGSPLGRRTSCHAEATADAEAAQEIFGRRSDLVAETRQGRLRGRRGRRAPPSPSPGWSALRTATAGELTEAGPVSGERRGSCRSPPVRVPPRQTGGRRHDPAARRSRERPTWPSGHEADDRGRRGAGPVAVPSRCSRGSSLRGCRRWGSGRHGRATPGERGARGERKPVHHRIVSTGRKEPSSQATPSLVTESNIGSACSTPRARAGPDRGHHDDVPEELAHATGVGTPASRARRRGWPTSNGAHRRRPPAGRSAAASVAHVVSATSEISASSWAAELPPPTTTPAVRPGWPRHGSPRCAAGCRRSPRRRGR